MSGTRHFNPVFILSNIFSRMLVPFAAVVYTSLREVSLSPEAGSSLDSWLLSGFSLSFFWLLQINVLKDENHRFLRRDLWFLGLFWAGLATLIQAIGFYHIYGIQWSVITASYSFMKLEPWPYMLVALFVAPRFCAIYARRWAL